MAGIDYFVTIAYIIGIGVSLVVFARIYNIIADVEIFGFKLPRIPL